MKRRKFITQLAKGSVCIPLVVAELGCDDDPTDPGGGGGGGGECLAGDSLRATSSLNSGHTHVVLIACNDIINAPAGRTYTSDGTSHTHTATLNAGDFEAIRNGQTVTVQSSNDAGHAHSWALSLG